MSERAVCWMLKNGLDTAMACLSATVGDHSRSQTYSQKPVKSQVSPISPPLREP